ncbi:MAG: ABC transporter ATP-binding protein/permease [Lentisphaeria bacterium]|nr:ABC transporter ATP-binding protein/permease [Lentisphaeria bacterium]
MKSLFKNICYLFSKRDVVHFTIIIVLMLGSTLLELASLGAVPLFVAMLTGDSSLSSVSRLGRVVEWLGIDMNEISLVTCGIILAVLFIFRTLYMALNFYAMARVLQNRKVELSARLFKAYMSAPYSFHLHHNSSVIITNIQTEAERVTSLVLARLIEMGRDGIIILSVVGLMLWYNWVVCLASFFSLALFGGGFILLVNNKNKKWGWREHELRQEGIKCISEGIGAYKEIRILGRIRHFCNRLHKLLEDMSICSRRMMIVHRFMWPFMELITVCVLLMMMGLMMVLNDGDTKAIAPTVALFAVCLARLKGTLTEFLSFFNGIQSIGGVLAALCDDLRDLESRPQQDDSVPDIPFESEIKMEGLTFHYDGKEGDVLRDVHLTVPRGSSLGIVGPSGSGKTTLANVLLGLLPPDKGRILVDGKDVATCMSAWQRHIGYVAQDIYLLDDTVRANIALGEDDDKIDEDALKMAIEASQLDEFLKTMPKGELTLLGERGVRLSGGQRQRVAIARALYRNPQLLVFDEATSALDTMTERAVVSAIERLRGNHTLIIIAHRLTTVKDCDNLVYMKDGSVIATGNYSELQEKVPEFKKMTMS